MDFIFIACVDLDDEYSGISRKVYSEYKALCNNFCVGLIGYAGNSVKVIEGENINVITGKKHRRLLLMDEVAKIAREQNIRFAYIRRMPCNPFVIGMLRKLKKQGVIKVVWEIPTYPYDYENNENAGIHSKFIGSLDIIFRRSLKNYVNKIVTFSNDTVIFGIPAINTGNGIDVSAIEPRITNENTNVLNMIAVAVLNPWHGYDRLITGIYEYYRKGGERPVYFHLVGDGKCLDQYKALAEELKIEDHIIFYGFRNQDEINIIYNKCNIAVDSLGWHRSRVELGTSLKSREYIAKGLPIIASTPMDMFPSGWNYAYYAPVDDSPIDIEEVIVFFDRIHRGIKEKELSETIRDVAYKKCDMTQMMLPIIEYYNFE